MNFLCCRSERREMVAKSSMNGIDFLEVLEGKNGPRTRLRIHLLKELPNSVLDLIDGRIDGGERIRDVSVKMEIDADPQVISAQLNHTGDLSPYTLQLLKKNKENAAEQSQEPPDGFDLVLSRIDFSFTEGCPSSKIDCKSSVECYQEKAEEPDIDYLAKDYASLRKLILDRMSLLMPKWKEGNPADLGVVLAELLAYVGDHLSYQQDAVATEAYMGTARSRISVRRHARLVDYFMHDGCNARTCAQIEVEHDILEVDKDHPALPKGTKLLTFIEGQAKRISSESDATIYDRAAAVFETMEDKENLYTNHNRIDFYTWGAKECCLPKGATSAWLDGNFPDLRKGDLLIFEEILGPKSGDAVDADRCHRHVVRLNKDARVIEDPIGGLFNQDPREESYVFSWEKIPGKDEGSLIDSITKKFGFDWVKDAKIEKIENDKTIKVSGEKNSLLLKLNDKNNKVTLEIDDLERDEFIAKMKEDELNIYKESVSVTEIEWGDEDALPFPLCISSLSDEEHGEMHLTGVSVALGNVVLADHGLTIPYGLIIPFSENLEKSRKNLEQAKLEILGSVPKPSMVIRSAEEGDRCQDQAQNAIRPRFNPKLNSQPLTQVSRPYTDSKTGKRLAIDPSASAAAALRSWAEKASPDIIVLDSEDHLWSPVPDLLNSDATAKEFVAEMDEEGFASLRFGDSHFGSSPKTGAKFYAAYRVGNGASGNIGSDCLVHIVSDDHSITGVRNPLPATCGVDPESIDEVRQRAPAALHRQERAVTPQDYADIAERHLQVQRAVANFRWTGSWHTVFLTVDRLGGEDVNDDFAGEMAGYLEKYRMAGHDLQVEGPQYVSLEITMRVCLKDDYLPWDVREALLKKFSNRTFPDGSRGIFHPDNFSFGEPVYLSRLYEAARSVEGVSRVVIKQFQRQGQDSADGDGLVNGYLEFGRLEIARLNNDPNFPEQGLFHLLIGDGP
jgi:hypothetical protein